MHYLAPEIRKQLYKKYEDINMDKLKADIFSLELIMVYKILKNKDIE